MPDRSGAGRYRPASARFASTLSIALAVSMTTAGLAQAGPAQAAPTGAAQSAADPQASAILIRLVKEFTGAQQSFDAPKLARLTTPDYLEISPAGELDSREKMLGFYAPDKKIAAPELVISDVTVRRYGDAAVLIARIAYTVQPPGQPVRTVELRAGFVAHRSSGDWKIASAQYTGIRPSAK